MSASTQLNQKSNSRTTNFTQPELTSRNLTINYTNTLRTGSSSCVRNTVCTLVGWRCASLAA